MQRHLHALLDQIAALLTALGDSDADPQTLADLAHAIAGDAGQLGFSGLSVAARALVAAIDQQAEGIGKLVATLSQAAAQARESLLQYLSASCNACMASAKLT